MKLESYYSIINIIILDYFIKHRCQAMAREKLKISLFDYDFLKYTLYYNEHMWTKFRLLIFDIRICHNAFKTPLIILNYIC